MKEASVVITKGRDHLDEEQLVFVQTLSVAGMLSIMLIII